MDMYWLKPSKWQSLPSKLPCNANFDNAVPVLAGFNRPTRCEGEVRNLEVYGKIPPSISGTFYRIVPEPYYVPFVENDVEPQFDPRHPGAAEGNGYLVALVNSFDEMSSELVTVDCDDFEKHAAIAKLPVRLRPGFHGNWVDDSDINGRPVTVPESAVPHRGNGSNGRKETNGERDQGGLVGVV
ncbi:Lignostilbene-alpha,beta-dioxygenase isozyme III [Colletotrichum trifolii]|uniref:Lignostilbene-alpha,beta-dioxygenase isozyme III n=1 Tax=Colletotrichum trifolii TaxID=5466 RepID=A0A4V6QF13_COLTR|nr:Lignostilbene-alpha,beta-dioxygenase isozyme III [Colletotrichum trifolii]